MKPIPSANPFSSEPIRRRAGRCGLLLLLTAFLGGLPVRAQEPLVPGVTVSAAAEKTTLIRGTSRLRSTVDVTLTNAGAKTIEPPLHAVVTFTPESGTALTGLTVPGAAGGLGAAPYQTFFFDLSAQAPQGLPAGGVLTLPLGFERPSTLTVKYDVALHGIVNRDPVADPGGPYAATAGAPLSLDGSRSADPDNDPLTLQWRFEDGTTADGAVVQKAFAAPGLHEVTLTATDGRGGESVRIAAVAVTPDGEFALGRSRVLDGNGHPLPVAEIRETGPAGVRTFTAGAETGFASLGGLPGEYVWRFSAPGHLPVWRRAELPAGTVTLIPSPWLPALPAGGTPVSLLEETRIASADGSVALTFPPGAFPQPGDAILTALGGQSLPAPLPPGWSPLAGFHLTLPDGSPVGPGTLALTFPAAPPAGRPLVLVSYDSATGQWKNAAPLSLSGASLTASLPAAGSWVVALPDLAPSAPPLPADGEFLAAAALPADVPDGITALGTVSPAESAASTDPARVTATGTVDFTSPSALPSGVWFRTAVAETYDLRDGSRFRTPDYDTTFFAWQGLADNNPATLQSTFPLRPRILLGGDLLTQAQIHVDVLAPGGITSAVFSADGGELTASGIRILIPAGASGGLGTGELRALDPAAFAGAAPGYPIAAAFSLDFAGFLPGSVLTFRYTGKADPLADYVLARFLTDGLSSGLQPVLRLRSDAAGFLSTSEPAGELSGLDRAGQYTVVKLPAPQALVHGIVRLATDNSPAPGASVRLTGQPWLSLTPATGAYQLLAPAGPFTLTALRDFEGFTGRATGDMPDPLAAQSLDIPLGAAAPFILTTSPAAEATKVPVVTPVTITFSERMAAGPFAVPGAIRVVDPDDADIPATLTLDLSGRTATLLPLNPLTAATEYRLFVSPALPDLQGQTLTGPDVFPFTTAAPAARGDGAQLVIYEPGGAGPSPADRAIIDAIPGYTPGSDNTKVVATGGPGTADPEVPVILVNETTGTTATVLSKADGSFANFIDAAEEDFISATFVNTNGTRVTIPATRQKFDDGRVGLYQQGGILEASNEGAGRVEVIVEPDSVENRTVFNVEVLTPAEVRRQIGDVPPEGATLLGALKFQEEGELTRTYSNVRFEVDVADLGLPPDTAPEDAGYALTVPRRVDGTIIYEVIDSMHFENLGGGKGVLVTASPPFVGLLLRQIAALRAETGIADTLSIISRTILDGSIGTVLPAGAFAIPVVYRQVAVSSVHGKVFAPAGVPLAGALVRVAPRGIDFTPKSMRAGEFVAVSDQAGDYRFHLPTFLTSQVVATHRRFPFQSATAGFANAGLISGLRADFVFSIPPPANLAIPDTSPPQVSVRQLSQVGTIGNGPGDGMVLDVTVVDDLKVEDVTIQLEDFSTLIGNKSLIPDLAEEELAGLQPVLTSSDDAISPSLSHEQFRVQSRRSGRAVYLVTATDGTNPQTSFLYTVVFSTAPPSPEDTTPPRVSFIWPPSDAAGVEGGGVTGARVARGTPLQIRFSSPLPAGQVQQLSDPLKAATLIQLGPVGVQLLHVAVSPDFRELTVSYWTPDPSVNHLTLTIDPSIASQEPQQAAAGVDAPVLPFSNYHLTFAGASSLTLPASAQLEGQFGGVVQTGTHVYVLDRVSGDGFAGKIRHFNVTSSAGTAGLAEAGVTELRASAGRPMDLVVIPGYQIRHIDGTVDPERNYLVVYTGDVIGNVIDGAVVTSLKRAQVFLIGDDGELTGFFTGPDAPVLSESVSLVTRARWDPPFLSFLEIGSDNTSVVLTTFNGLLTAVEARKQSLFDSLLTSGQAGLDLNNDGDFADEGEKVPLPARIPGLAGGVEFSWAPADARERVNDYDASADFGLLGAVFRGPAGNGFNMILGGAQGQVDDTTARILFPEEPKRMKILPQQSLVDPGAIAVQGTSAPEIVRDIALVSCVNSSPGAPPVLLVIDITRPDIPVLLTRAFLPEDVGTLNSIVPRGDGLLAVSATPGGLFLLDPRLLLVKDAGGTTAALRQQLPGLETNASSFVSSASGLNFGNAGAKLSAALSQPSIRVVRFDGEAPVPAQSVAEALRADAQTASAAWDRRLLQMRNVELNGEAAIFDDARPLAPESHHYVVIEAPGSAADAEGRLPLAAAAVAESGLPVLPSLSNRAPTFIGEEKITRQMAFFGAMKVAHFLTDIDFSQPESEIVSQLSGKLASLTVDQLLARFYDKAPAYGSELTAWRLSNNPASPLYNTFLAGPLVLLHRDLPPAFVADDAGSVHRSYLRAAPYYWVGLAPRLKGEPLTGPFASTQVDDLDATFNARTGEIYADLKGIVAASAGGSVPGGVVKVVQAVVKRIDVELERSMHPGHVALVNFGFRRNPLIFIPGVMASRLTDTGAEDGQDARWVSVVSGAMAHLAVLIDGLPAPGPLADLKAAAVVALRARVAALGYSPAGTPVSPALDTNDILRRITLEEVAQEANALPVIGGFLPSGVAGKVLDAILRSVSKPIYQPVILYLQGYLGYDEYLSDGRQDDFTLAHANWQSLKSNPDFFVFPYDWRQPNEVSAERLALLVDMIRVAHPDSPKVDILCHSMGGLVARRYVMDHPGRVDRFISIVSPYLGATKAVYAVKQGDFDELAMSVFVPQKQMQAITRHMPAVHQLMPNKGLLDLGFRPIVEKGWDLDGNGRRNDVFDYAGYRRVMDGGYFRIPADELSAFPADDLPILSAQPKPMANNNEAFATAAGAGSSAGSQVDWRADQPGAVRYTHFVALQSAPHTISTLEARPVLVPQESKPNVSLMLPPVELFDSEEKNGLDEPVLPATTRPLATDESKAYRLTWTPDIVRGAGDGTVPFLSQTRGYHSDGTDFNERAALMFPLLNPSGREEDDNLAGHNGVLTNPQLLAWIGKALQDELTAASQPVVAITGSPAAEGSVSTFTATISNAPALPLSQRRISWDMGDGTVLTGETVSHVWLNDGRYTVTCAVSWEPGSDVAPADGEEAAGDSFRRISSRPTFGAVAARSVLVPDDSGGYQITGPAGPVLPGAPVTFRLDAAGAAKSDDVYYRWDAGGQTNVKQGPTAYVMRHSFDSEGTFPVSVHVEDDDGSVTTATTTVTVSLNAAAAPAAPLRRPRNSPPADPVFSAQSVEFVELRVVGHAAEADGLDVLHDGVTVYDGNAETGSSGQVLRHLASEPGESGGPRVETIRVPRRAFDGDDDVTETIVRLTGDAAQMQVRLTHYPPGKAPRCYNFDLKYSPPLLTDGTVDFVVNWEALPILSGSEISNVVDPGSGFTLESAGIEPCDFHAPSLDFSFDAGPAGLKITAEDDTVPDGGPVPPGDGFVATSLGGPPITADDLTTTDEGSCDDLIGTVLMRTTTLTGTRDAPPGVLTAVDAQQLVSVPTQLDCPAGQEELSDSEITEIQDAVKKAFTDTAQLTLFKRFVFNPDDLWIFEQGSGALLWKATDGANDHIRQTARAKLRGVYVKGKSDNDYEIFLPVFKSENGGGGISGLNPGNPADRAQFRFRASQAEVMNGDWYFKRPRGQKLVNGSLRDLGLPPDPEDKVEWNRFVDAVDFWFYDVPFVNAPEGTTMDSTWTGRIPKNFPTIPGAVSVFANPATPAEVISHLLTETVKQSATLKATLPDVSFFPFRREHLLFAHLSLEKPPPFGDDPVGDAGMGRELLLLKWLLEGTFLPPFGSFNHEIADDTTLRTEVFDRLVSDASVLPVEGFEWGIYQQWAILRDASQFRVRPRGTSGVDQAALRARERCRQVFGTFLDTHDDKVMKKIGKACIRAALATMAADANSHAAIFGTDPGEFDSSLDFRSFEHFVAATARTRAAADSALFGGLPPEAFDLFLKAKVGNETALCVIRRSAAGVDGFVEAGHDFLRSVQVRTAGTYRSEMEAMLTAGRVPEFVLRMENARAIDYGFESLAGPQSGRLQLLGRSGDAALKYSFLVTVGKNRKDAEVGPFSVILDPGAGASTVTCSGLVIPAGETHLTVKHKDADGSPVLTIRRPAADAGAPPAGLSIRLDGLDADDNTDARDDTAKLESEILAVNAFQDPATVPAPGTRWVYRGMRLSTTAYESLKTDQLENGRLLAPYHFNTPAPGNPPLTLAGARALMLQEFEQRLAADPVEFLPFIEADLDVMPQDQLLAIAHTGHTSPGLGQDFTPFISTAETIEVPMNFALDKQNDVRLLLAIEMPASEGIEYAPLATTTSSGEPVLIRVNGDEGREVIFTDEMRFLRCLLFEIDANGATDSSGPYALRYIDTYP